MSSFIRGCVTRKPTLRSRLKEQNAGSYHFVRVRAASWIERTMSSFLGETEPGGKRDSSPTVRSAEATLRIPSCDRGKGKGSIEERSHFLISILSCVLSNSTRQYQRPPSRSVPPSSTTSPPRMGWVGWYPWSAKVEVAVATLPVSSPTPCRFSSFQGCCFSRVPSCFSLARTLDPPPILYYTDINSLGIRYRLESKIIAGKLSSFWY